MVKDFSYRLKSSTGNYYRVVGDNLIADTDVVELEHAPDGWQQKSINWKRNWDSFGVIRGFTVPLRFVLDGAKILKYLFYESGYEADCVLEILQLNNSREYDLIFSGEIDFTTYEQINDFVTVNAIEGGAQKLVNAAKDTIFEIPVNNSESVNIRLDGINLHSKLRYDITGSASFSDVSDGLSLSGFVYLNSEGENLFIFPADYLSFKDVSAGYHTTSNDWMFSTIAELNIRFAGHYRIFINNIPSGNTIKLNIKCSNGSWFNILTINTTGTRFYDKPFDINHTIPANVKCFLEVETSTTVDINTRGGYITLEFLNKKTESFCKAIRPITLFNELCKKIGVTGYSNLLQKIPIGITTLDGILSINDSGIIKTKLSDFLKFCFTRFSSTWYIDELDRLRIESIDTAFNNQEIIKIEKVNDVKITILKEPLFKLVSAGYETQTVDEVNGKYGFNAKQQWRTDLKRVNNTLDMVCPYIADPYAIELNRIKLQGKTTTDSKNDNSVFLLAYDETFVITAKNSVGNEFSAYTLKRYSGMIGVIDDSIFNFDLSPRHGLVNNARLLKSLLWKSSEILKLQSGEKNTEIASPGFVEKKDLNLSGYAGLFAPIMLSFTPLIEESIYQILKSNPRGKVAFNLYGNWFYGFISDISIQPKTGETQNWSLISAPENNLMLLSELAGKCDAIKISESELPQAGKDTPYLYEIPITGTPAIIISNNSIINGMEVSLIYSGLGNKLRISGTPLVSGLMAILFTLTNCSGSKDYSLNLMVSNVSAPSSLATDINYSADGLTMELHSVWTNGSFSSEFYVYKDGNLLSGYPVIVGPGDGEASFVANYSSTYKIRVRNTNGSEYSNFIETEYTTPQLCNSYTIINDRRVTFLQYVDCNGVTKNVDVAPYQSFTFCAKSITPTGATIVNNGPC